MYILTGDYKNISTEFRAEKAKQETVKIKGEVALQGWAQRQLMTITDGQLDSYSKGQGWTKGWVS